MYTVYIGGVSFTQHFTWLLIAEKGQTGCIEEVCSKARMLQVHGVYLANCVTRMSLLKTGETYLQKMT